MKAWLALVVIGCNSAPAPSRAAPVAALPAGPVPVALPALAPAQLRTLTAAMGFATIAADGAVHVGRSATGNPPYQGTRLGRGESAFANVLSPDDHPHWVPEEHEVRYDTDQYAVLSTATTTEAVVLADGATPARITANAGLGAFGFHAVDLAAGAANTVSRYRFGEAPWQLEVPDATLRVGQPAPAGAHHALLQYTDTTTTAELVTALGTLSAAGIEHVRLHRMMGWGEVPPDDIVSVEGATSRDDRITSGEPANVDIGEPQVDGELHAAGVHVALVSAAPRFRYCYEKRGRPKLRGRVALSFDVTADGAIHGATATGLDHAIASCVAGAVFDLDITPRAVPGPGHVGVAIEFQRAPEPEPEAAPPVRGFWCVRADDIGRCGREQWQCEALREGMVNANAALGGTMQISECTAQRTAWTSDGTHFAPSKQMCGARCRTIR